MRMITNRMVTEKISEKFRSYAEEEVEMMYETVKGNDNVQLEVHSVV